MPARNKRFHRHEPFQHDENLRFERAEGPVGWFNPTRAHFLYPVVSRVKDDAAKIHDSSNSPPDSKQNPDSQPELTQPAKSVRFLWRSRDNRKGRHALLVQRPAPGEESHFVTPRRTSDPREVLKNIKRTFTYFPVWDVSWLVAFIFTWGSVVWVLNVRMT